MLMKRADSKGILQTVQVLDKKNEVAATVCFRVHMLKQREEISTTFWRTLLRVVDCDGDATTVSREDLTALLQFLEVPKEAASDVANTMFTTPEVEAVQMNDAVEALVQVSTKHDLVSQRFPADVITGRSLAGLSAFEKECYLLQSLDHGNSNRMAGAAVKEERLHNAWMAAMANDWTPPPRQRNALNKQESNFVSTRQVRNRATGMMENEFISNMVWLSLKAIYSKLFLEGVSGLLDTLTAKMSVNAKNPKIGANLIKHFIEEYNINIDEIRDPLDSFKTLDEFFVRRLKPAARPIAEPDNPRLLVSAADSRLMTFTSLSKATRAWVKGNRFSVEALLGGDRELAARFEGGSMTIFRLAPQDYHCYHFPCNGKLVSTTFLPGKLYSVNPIVVQHERVNVFTENVRCVNLIESEEFGSVVLIAVGATIIGSITQFVEPGQSGLKGEIFGNFSYGGSTVIMLTQKDRLEFDHDLVTCSEVETVETLVRMGERLGSARSPTDSSSS